MTFAAGIDDTEADALAALSASDAAALIASVLPPMAADVVLLRVVGDCSVIEVAEILGVTPGYVRVVAHRGLKALAEHFSRGSVTRVAGPGISEVP